MIIWKVKWDLASPQLEIFPYHLIILLIKNLPSNYCMSILLLLFKCHLYFAPVLIVFFPITCALRITMALVVWNVLSHASNFMCPLSKSSHTYLVLLIKECCCQMPSVRFFTYFLKIWLKYYLLQELPKSLWLCSKN